MCSAAVQDVDLQDLAVKGPEPRNLQDNLDDAIEATQDAAEDATTAMKRCAASVGANRRDGNADTKRKRPLAAALPRREIPGTIFIDLTRMREAGRRNSVVIVSLRHSRTQCALRRRRNRVRSRYRSSVLFFFCANVSTRLPVRHCATIYRHVRARAFHSRVHPRVRPKRARRIAHNPPAPQ